MCNRRATKRGKKRMKRNKVLRGGPEPLIFFSLVHAPRVMQPLARIYFPAFLIHPISHSLAPFRSSVFTLAYIFFLSLSLSLSLTFSFHPLFLSPKTLTRGLTSVISSPPPLGYRYFRAISEAGSHLTIFARRDLQGKQIER